MDHLICLLFLLLGLIIGIIVVLLINAIRFKNNENKINKMLINAKTEANIIKTDALKEAEEKSLLLETKVLKELNEKKAEYKKEGLRLEQREESLSKRDDILQKRELLMDEKEQKNFLLQEKNNEKKIQLDRIYNEELLKLEKISNYSAVEAKRILIEKINESCELEFSNLIKEKSREANFTAKEQSKNILVSAMQRYVGDLVVSENVTIVEIPNEEMKGKLIGREGRNIRTIEAITGVDLIIDDTPGVVVLSCFDPLRREIARICLQTMIKDGKIHPSRIEDLYEKVSSDIVDEINEIAKSVLIELGINMYEEELITIVGKLKYRSSFGQNALQHSVEVAYLAGNIAAELGEDITLARRAGLLHDIGKAINTEIGGSHVDIGKEIAKKYKENEVVINSIASHHGDEDATSIISVIVGIADAISASRPGARRDSSENYFRRLEDLEKIGNGFEGVEKAFAVQAGRELRIIVNPKEVDDIASFKLAREIKNKIESEMSYPGVIKVVVIRQTRIEEQAK